MTICIVKKRELQQRVLLRNRTSFPFLLSTLWNGRATISLSRGQSRTCASYAEARNGRMIFNHFCRKIIFFSLPPQKFANIFLYLANTYNFPPYRISNFISLQVAPQISFEMVIYVSFLLLRFGNLSNLDCTRLVSQLRVIYKWG